MRLCLKEWLDEHIVHARFHRCILERLLGVSRHAANEGLLNIGIRLKHAAYRSGCGPSIAHWHAKVHEDKFVHALTRL